MARRRSTNSPAGPGKVGKGINEISGVILFGLGVVVLLSLVSYNAADPSWNTTGPQLKASNWIGPVGAMLADGLYQAFGYVALLTPFLLFILAWWRFNPGESVSRDKLLGCGLLLTALFGLLALAESCTLSGSFHAGGWLGYLLTCDETYGLRRFFNTTGSAIILALLLVSGLILATPFSLVGMIVHLTPREREAGLVTALSERFRAWRQLREAERELRALEREKARQERLQQLRAPVEAERAASEDRTVIRARAQDEQKPSRAEVPKTEAAKEEKREERKSRLTTLGLTESLHEVLPPRGKAKGENGRESKEDDDAVTIVKPEIVASATTISPAKETARESVKDQAREQAREQVREQAREQVDATARSLGKEPIKETGKDLGSKAASATSSRSTKELSPPAAESATLIDEANEAGQARAQTTSTSASSPASPGWRSRISDWRNRGRTPDSPPLSDPLAGADNESADVRDDDLTSGVETELALDPPPSRPAHSAPAASPPPAWPRYPDLPSRGERTGERTVEEMLATASVHRAPVDETEASAKNARQAKNLVRTVSEFKYPTTDMLTAPEPRSEMADTELMERAQQLAEKCREFNVAGVVKQISPGPVVTTFEFKLDPGVKYGRVTSLVDDLCLGLKAESIRIDRIPGKSTVGIEVPNQRREIIRLREVIESQKFRESPSKLTIALGKTIDGSNYIADLAKMPHLLIAGATGAGKSVALNTILASLLYKAAPDEVKLILIDPKRLELGLYADIPHLLTPIVTDPKRASYALKWAVSEMENRYKHLASFGVRNIDQYNQEVSAMVDRSLAEESDELPKPLPYIVVIIDELADLMMVSARDVEESITRLAQMARAVGIHLVLATQRPSTDVITGLIKANFPSRISFRVSSKVDSRVIIDTNGAEGLLGQGDMLFLPPGSSRLIRVHGAFVDEKEVKRIADHVRAQRKPVYDGRIQMSEKELEGEDLAEMRRDEKYEEALRIVFEMGRASTSVLQRRLRIGYGRAASIIDMMHREGIVGPEDGSKPRQVLVSEQDRADFLERLAQMREEGD